MPHLPHPTPLHPMRGPHHKHKAQSGSSDTEQAPELRPIRSPPYSPAINRNDKTTPHREVTLKI
jgi:hypothetical protein